MSLKCRSLVEMVTAYFDGALPETEHRAFEQHVRHCAKCRAFVEQARKTIAALAHLREQDVPSGDSERLVNMFRAWKAESPGT
jgi:anti-sigma factor RsiW